MKTITESARQVPVIDEVDVLVVGSGPGGLSAALAAARAGVRTMLEPQSKSEALNADMFKVVADALVEEAGVTPLMHAVAIDAVMDGDAITGVIVHSKSGRGEILARRVIDASVTPTWRSTPGRRFI
jgi:thioredoxin reductase